MKIGWGARKWLNPGEVRYFREVIGEGLSEDVWAKTQKTEVSLVPRAFQGERQQVQRPWGWLYVASSASREGWYSWVQQRLMWWYFYLLFVSATGELLMQFRCCPPPGNWGHLSVHLENSDLITYPLPVGSTLCRITAQRPTNIPAVFWWCLCPPPQPRLWRTPDCIRFYLRFL